ncbi:hypothetical protein [Spirosoma harenae]
MEDIDRITTVAALKQLVLNQLFAYNIKIYSVKKATTGSLYIGCLNGKIRLSNHHNPRKADGVNCSILFPVSTVEAVKMVHYFISQQYPSRIARNRSKMRLIN